MSVDEILRSGSYVEASEDLELLQRDDLRPVRLQLELVKPELYQQAAGILSTIVVFGSSRVRDPETARQDLESARAAAGRHPDDAEHQHRLKVAHWSTRV